LTASRCYKKRAGHLHDRVFEPHTVHLVSASQEAETSATVPSDVDDADELDVGLTVGNLPSALGGVESVVPTATFDEAITLMLLNGYSQLAVAVRQAQLAGCGDLEVDRAPGTLTHPPASPTPSSPPMRHATTKS